MLPSPEIPREKPTPKEQPLLADADLRGLVRGRSSEAVEPEALRNKVATLSEKERQNLTKLIDLHLTELQRRVEVAA